MSEFGEMLKQMSASNVTSVEKLIAEYGGLVTLTGFEYVEGKYGLSPVFRIAEDGKRFWATGKMFGIVIEKLIAKYGTAEALEKELELHPQRIRLHPLKYTKGGNKFRPIEFLGDAKDES